LAAETMAAAERVEKVVVEILAASRAREERERVRVEVLCRAVRQGWR
jgi:hypothetical protein